MLHTWIAHFFALGHFDVYRYYFQQFGSESFQGSIAAGFPPAFYILEGTYVFVLIKLHLVSFFSVWDAANVWTFSQQARTFFFMKAFLIPFDLLGFAAFLKCLKRSERLKGAYAWMLNPAIIYVTYVWGQTDIIAASLTMVAIYFIQISIVNHNSKAGILSCVAIGLAASFKLFAIALLPVFAIFACRNTNRPLTYFIAAGASPLAIMIPFISEPFLRSMFPFQDYLLSRNFPVPPASQFTIYLPLAVYLAILYSVNMRCNDFNFDRFLTYGLAVFSLLFGLSIWNPNWLLWMLPFLLITVVRKPTLFPVYALLIVFYFVFVQAWGNILWIGMFCPLTSMNNCLPVPYGGTLANFPSISNLIPNYFSILVGLAYTGISVSMFFIVYDLWKGHRERGLIRRTPAWLVVLFVPVALALATLSINYRFIQEHGLPILGTIHAKMVEDPIFFEAYLATIVLVCIWFFTAVMIRKRFARTSDFAIKRNTDRGNRQRNGHV